MVHVLYRLLDMAVDVAARRVTAPARDGSEENLRVAASLLHWALLCTFRHVRSVAHSCGASESERSTALSVLHADVDSDTKCAIFRTSQLQELLGLDAAELGRLNPQGSADACLLLFETEYAAESDTAMGLLLEAASNAVRVGGVVFGLVIDAAQVWSLAQKQVEVRELLKAKRRHQRRKQIEQERKELGLTGLELPDELSDEPDSRASSHALSIMIDRPIFTIKLPMGDVFGAFGNMCSVAIPMLANSTLSAEMDRAESEPDSKSETRPAGIESLSEAESADGTGSASRPSSRTHIPWGSTKQKVRLNESAARGREVESELYLFHCGSFLRIAHEHHLRTVEFVNLREFVETHRKTDAELLHRALGSVHVDSSAAIPATGLGRNLPADAIDLLGLFSLFTLIKQS